MKPLKPSIGAQNMNNNAKQWVQALRSGGYQQANGQLVKRARLPWRQDTFCALGVLYDLYLKSNKKEWPASTPGRLPVGALSWVGVSRGFEETIIMHNDMQISFRDVAGIVEVHFERLAYWKRFQKADQITRRAIENAKQMTKYCNQLAEGSVDQQESLVVEA